ncbi:MAG: bifunctional hydroxymethylpyrimidine kinase/phosphomethylpyrimidine kinase, partial [Deltaproteobacteria bacterium]|nr:bifunctional hydroxymethylpyrimidine kinase/phosphomethylpyrimidine kinase [Deltaproteobacteria bacterium]
NDSLGNALVKQLTERKVNVDGVVRSHIVSTTAKTRIMAGDDHTSKQQVIRIDKKNDEPIPARLRTRIYDHFAKISKEVDAVLVSDYGYGVISPRIITELAPLAKQKPVVVDSRYQLMRFRGVTAVTPNESEAEMASRIRIVDDKDVKRAAVSLKKRLSLRAVLITRGNRGMSLLEDAGRLWHIPIVGGDDITDVTGAGDTVATVFTLAVAAGAGFYDAARLANCAAGIVVMKTGTAVVTTAELTDAVKRTYGRG